MKAIKKAMDFALLLIGGTPRRALTGESKDNPAMTPSRMRAGGAGVASQTRESAELNDGASNVGADKRAPVEVQRYEHLPASFDTRVHLDRGWLNCLLKAEPWQSLSKLDENDTKEADQASQQLCLRMFDLISHLSTELNNIAGQVISLTPPSEVSERIKKPNAFTGLEKTESVSFKRWRASTLSWSLSARARSGLIEIFLVPASDLMMLSGAEAPIRMKLQLELKKLGSHFIWTHDNLPVAAEDLRLLVRSAFRDLVSMTQDQAQPLQSRSAFGNLDDAKLAKSLEQLVAERENLAQKVVIQQEEIQKRIARDLHDAVISDVMAIKRNLASGKAMPRDISEALDVVVQKLREICYDLSPRDLSDWGLATVIEDMLEQMAQRTGTDCSLNCDIDVPTMPSAVQLHIYRIVQESLNNAEKYARPSKVVVTLEMQNSRFLVLIADNGQGFDMSATGTVSRAGGYGMGSLRERADLIRCFYPTQLEMQSAVGKGTRVKLEIDLSSFR